MDKRMDHKGMDHKGMGHRVSLGPVRGPARQRGSVLALVTVGMLAIIGMAGLALQSGHLFVNKTHLQNALDAAALSAAKTLKTTGGTVEPAEAAGSAAAAGLAAFNQHLAPDVGDSTFLERELTAAEVTPTFEFSATLDPFTPGAKETDDPPATFVRARVTGFFMNTWLANVFDSVQDRQDIGGTAVAGPAPVDPNNTCDIAPLVMCALVPDPVSNDGKDCSDGDCYGFNPGPNEEIVLHDDQHGPGTFKILDTTRGQLAGGYSGCASVGENLVTRPNATFRNMVRGFNTRFGIYTGGLSSSDGAPDTVTYSENGVDTNPNHHIGSCTFCYDDYTARQHSEQYNHEPQPNGIGVPERRVLAVPIGRCPAGPTATVEVLAIGCFFMTRPAVENPPGPVEAEIYGQLISECEVDGSISTTPSDGTLRYKIVLFKDSNSRDS